MKMSFFKRPLCLLLLASTVLGGCATAQHTVSSDGTSVRLSFVENSPETKRFFDNRDATYNGDLSPNFYDYEGQYALKFIGEGSAEKLDPKDPGFVLKDALVKGTMAMAATDLVMRPRLLGGRPIFSKSANVAALLVGSISPQSPEEVFVQSVGSRYRAITSNGVSFLRVDPLGSESTSERRNSIFDLRMSEMRRANKIEPFQCADTFETLYDGFMRQTNFPKDCKGNGGTFKYTRSSTLAPAKSLMGQAFGPAIVSRLSFTNVPKESIDQLVAESIRVLGKDWIAVYPKAQSDKATKIVVLQGERVREYDPPPKPFQ